ncbi:PHF5-like [Carpediemonas membranifera]|uniref:PHF5-like n=1 Tax=Carpediemonas membranifera TaxID=201153 RepID=A0A8J6B1Z8_9EUKA|nr:PHF5-like [Carpediemonas membranifera]|eukprot:KAG9394008.1 PHF5-like [Carpediemonas membranifera]
MAVKHQADLILCRKLAGMHAGRVCANCQGRCPLCDSFVHQDEPVLICEDCYQSGYKDKCIVCGSRATDDAHYCKECVRHGKDRDGCPVVINIGGARMDSFFQRMMTK